MHLQEKDTGIQIEVLKRILSSTDDEINDYNFILQCISEYGIYPYERVKNLFKDCRYTYNGMMQVPSEFALFCNYISNFKINTALELGVYRGRSSYFMCAVLFRKNRNLKYYMADIYDKLDNFEMFSDILPIIKCIPQTSESYQKEHFDFVFIDADHSYDESMKDFINVGQYADKLVCFHDIYAHEYDVLNGGIGRTWREVTAMMNMTALTFSQFPNQWMGIGVGVKKVCNQEKSIDFLNLSQDTQAMFGLLKNFIKEFPYIYLYGTGHYAEIMYDYIKKYTKAEIAGFIISDYQQKQNNKIKDKKIYFLGEIEEDHSRCGVILTLPECYHIQVIRNLKDDNYDNVFLTTDALFTFMPEGSN